MREFQTNLRNIDCMEHMAEKPDKYYDLAIADPPYFSGPEKRKYYGSKISSHGVKRIEYKPLLKSWEIPKLDYYNELVRVSKHQIIWGINYFEFINKVTPGRIIWDKVNDGSSFSNCEIASCSLNKLRIDIFRFMWRGMMQGSPDDGTKMNGNKAKNEKRIHPTQKPVKLYRWLLRNYAKKGDIILDTHGGSCSSIIAAIKEGFDITVCEIDADYYNDAKKRILNYVSQLNIFIEKPIINFIDK